MQFLPSCPFPEYNRFRDLSLYTVRVVFVLLKIGVLVFIGTKPSRGFSFNSKLLKSRLAWSALFDFLTFSVDDLNVLTFKPDNTFFLTHFDYVPV